MSALVSPPAVAGQRVSELVDPVIQRERLTAQSLEAAAGDPEAMQLDEDFLEALDLHPTALVELGAGSTRPRSEAPVPRADDRACASRQRGPGAPLA